MANRLRDTVNLWKEMKPSALRRLALAAFFLFGQLGLVSILMESSIRVFPWTFVIYQTVAVGCFAASVVLVSRNRWWITALVVVFWMNVLLLNGGGVSFVFSGNEGLRVRLEGIGQRYDTRPHQTETGNLTGAELNDVYVQRGIIGAAVMAFLVLGYTSFISVIRGEIRRRAGLETEIKIAQIIQTSLLPPSSFETACCSIGALIVPASEVGGDYHDYVLLPDGSVAVAIADVTGHGVGAGIVSAMTKSALRLQLRHDPEPGAILANLNATIFEVSDAKTFVTFAYARFNPRSRTADLVTAGHPPILHRRQGSTEITQIRSTKNPALGMRRDVTFEAGTELRYSPGDSLLMYTDGVLEALNGKGEQFGPERLARVFSLAKGSPQEIVRSISEVVRAFAGNRVSYEDDVSIVCVTLR